MLRLPPTALDAMLLDLVQEEIPLCKRPYAELARRLGSKESIVLDRLAALHDGPTAPIRQLGAIFDSKALGYQSTLVAAKVPEDKLAAAAAVINRHPGVSHNYRRDHAYNLWYTLAVPPDSRIGLDRTVEILRNQSGATEMRMLPTLKMYKIGVKLNLQTPAAHPPRSAAIPTPRPTSVAINEISRKMIRALQQDLPIIPEPFAAEAASQNVDVDELLVAAAQFREHGVMRRFSAVLRHRELGFDANAMGVWIVPPARQDAFGSAAAQFPEVSHCYLRPSYPDFPYNIFTMIHAQDRQQAQAIVQSISDATGVKYFALLYSTEEYKKVRIRYFEPDIPAWESAALDAL